MLSMVKISEKGGVSIIPEMKTKGLRGEINEVIEIT